MVRVVDIGGSLSFHKSCYNGTIGFQNIIIPTLVNVPEDPRAILFGFYGEIRRKFVC